MLVYLRVCSNINDLIENLVFLPDPEEWRLCTDVSQLRVKVLLLHHGKNRQ